MALWSAFGWLEDAAHCLGGLWRVGGSSSVAAATGGYAPTTQGHVVSQTLPPETATVTQDVS